ncbi:MAG: cobalt-precorrin-5B (C(1))-methyltransferase CbiD [Oscillospiraceae bacterium]|nr:cobalt-precorrin-5B (C(1))-methyltransferase CbiD [Oscillospiraceae bacterium]
MLEEYISKDGRRLRLGYTTGSCAAGAAKAAAEALLCGRFPDAVRLMTPKGIELRLDILEKSISDASACCAVRKDSGDDPDITDGILIFARVERIDSGVDIVGGEGVGTVTKAGLDRPVGEPAINSVPRKMIAEAVMEIAELYEYRGGFRITVFVPGGEELAKKTYNPRMGIVGGISIIGTGGIVEPMSTRAIIDTIRAEANMRKAEGIRNLVLTLGNYGDDFLAGFLPGISEKNVKCSNYIGEAVDIAAELGFESALIVGHIGKLVKLGAGIMNTHSSFADGRMEVLVTCGLLGGCSKEALLKITNCATADGALDIINGEGRLEAVMEILCRRIQAHLDSYGKGRLRLGAVLFSNSYGLLGVTHEGEGLIRAVSEEYLNG